MDANESTVVIRVVFTAPDVLPLGLSESVDPDGPRRRFALSSGEVAQ